MICGKNESNGLGAEIVFWIDCSVDSGHIMCVCFGNNPSVCVPKLYLKLLYFQVRFCEIL